MSAHPLTDSCDDTVTAFMCLSRVQPNDVILLSGQRLTVISVGLAGDIQGAPVTAEYEWQDLDGWGWQGFLTLPATARVEVLR